MNGRAAGTSVIGVTLFLLLCLLAIPMLVVGGTSMLFAGGAGTNCSSSAGTAAQPGISTAAANSIPAGYLKWFRTVGLQYNVPWTILAGIGKVESNDGQTMLSGVHSGSNAFGAAGPMQIGISGASGNQWGGAPSHPASEVVNGVATDEDSNGIASVYDPADAIAGAAKYLVEHGVQQNVASAIFAYNHANWYVQEVLSWASRYATGGFTVSQVTPNAGTVAAGTGGSGIACTENSVLAAFAAPNATVATAVSYAQAQLGKPSRYGGTGPAAFDSSGLVMMAYRAAGVIIPRTAQQQWKSLPRVRPSKVLPGDLVFFAGHGGTRKAPAHVGLVIGKKMMIEASLPGTPIRVSMFGTPQSPAGDITVVGYARPWHKKGTVKHASG